MAKYEQERQLWQAKMQDDRVKKLRNRNFSEDSLDRPSP